MQVEKLDDEVYRFEWRGELIEVRFPTLDELEEYGIDIQIALELDEKSSEYLKTLSVEEKVELRKKGEYPKAKVNTAMYEFLELLGASPAVRTLPPKYLTKIINRFNLTGELGNGEKS